MYLNALVLLAKLCVNHDMCVLTLYSASSTRVERPPPDQQVALKPPSYETLSQLVCDGWVNSTVV